MQPDAAAVNGPVVACGAYAPKTGDVFHAQDQQATSAIRDFGAKADWIWPYDRRIKALGCGH
ncbi:MAG: hypothetical protein WBH04_11945 [Albidovulum sp.]